MSYVSLFLYYFSWHYGRAFFDIHTIWMNFLWFTVRVFSLKTLLRTFFAPWHRIHEAKKPRFDLSSAFSSFVVNTIMRVVGVIFRSVLIMIGIFASLLVFASGLFFYVIWIFIFPIILYLIGLGSMLIF